MLAQKLQCFPLISINEGLSLATYFALLGDTVQFIPEILTRNYDSNIVLLDTKTIIRSYNSYILLMIIKYMYVVVEYNLQCSFHRGILG